MFHVVNEGWHTTLIRKRPNLSLVRVVFLCPGAVVAKLRHLLCYSTISDQKAIILPPENNRDPSPLPITVILASLTSRRCLLR